jgi:hypothetical protein
MWTEDQIRQRCKDIVDGKIEQPSPVFVRDREFIYQLDTPWSHIPIFKDEKECPMGDANMIAFLARLLKMNEPRWIPVSERLPEIDQKVQTITKDGDMYVGYKPYSGVDYFWKLGAASVFIPTHWQPLPQPPKED